MNNASALVERLNRLSSELIAIQRELTEVATALAALPPPAPIVAPLETKVFVVVKVTRGTTTNGYPMWKCQTADGESIAIFDQPHSLLNPTQLLRQSAHWYHFNSLKARESDTWVKHPIQISASKAQSEKYWSIFAIAPLGKGAPDDPIPNHGNNAGEWIKSLKARAEALGLSDVSVEFVKVVPAFSTYEITLKAGGQVLVTHKNPFSLESGFRVFWREVTAEKLKKYVVEQKEG